jgi:hypothetical protein
MLRCLPLLEKEEVSLEFHKLFTPKLGLKPLDKRDENNNMSRMVYLGFWGRVEVKCKLEKLNLLHSID